MITILKKRKSTMQIMFKLGENCFVSIRFKVVAMKLIQMSKVKKSGLFKKYSDFWPNFIQVGS